MAPSLRITSGDEFPSLDHASQQQSSSTNKKGNPNKLRQQQDRVGEGNTWTSSSSGSSSGGSSSSTTRKAIERPAEVDDELSTISARHGETFLTCRIGSQFGDYRLDFHKIFKQRHVSRHSDFILTPIAPVRESSYHSEVDSFEAAPDLALHDDDWVKRVAVDLGCPSLDYFEPANARRFEKLFKHALYLGPPVIVITCPDSDIGQASLASIVNDRVRKKRSFNPYVLFRVSLSGSEYNSKPNTWHTQSSSNGVAPTSGTMDNGHSILESPDDKLPNDYCPWRLWNSIRCHLLPETELGVCLSIRDDLCGSQEELDRWLGEPVRMIIISTDQFVRSPGFDSRLRLTSKCKEFISKVMLANSLKTGLVIESSFGQNLAEHMQYLRNFVNEIDLSNKDQLRGWNDNIQTPLQPLSSNLDSSTYNAFEMDTKKYLQYRDSMIEAIDRLLLTGGHSYNDSQQKRQTFVVMVLGAGRGPLVDNFIDAIRTVNSKHRFKIYALDKNPSSIRSLKFKQAHHWQDLSGNDMFEVDVIQSDMREWRPTNLKADIIATELLGSFGDNELSPECIDGVWPISTPKTISIPQEYSSYLAPISSYRMVQRLNRFKQEEPCWDQIYVSKLTNYYMIDKPQELFNFDHKDLSVPAEKRCNERFKRLTFTAKADTVCHGFAGYFEAHLFGTTYISTLDGRSTPNMSSWFPTFIPIQEPVQLAKGAQLEVLFWRKENSTSIWYEWTIVKPVRSRIYSQSGINTLMSKFIS